MELKFLWAFILLTSNTVFAQEKTFLEAIDSIVARDPRLSSAHAQSDFATVNHVSRYTAFLPTVSMLARESKDYSLDSQNTLVSAQANLNLWHFGSDFAALSAAAFGKTVAEANVEQTTLEIEAQALNALLDYIQMQEEVSIAKKLLESKDESLKLTEERFQRGLNPEQEVLKAQVDLANAKARLSNLEIEQQTANAQVKSLLGDSEVSPKWPWIEKLNSTHALEFAQDFEQIGQRPDLRKLEAQMFVEQNFSKKSWREIFPSLDLSVERQMNHPKGLNRDYDTTAALTLTMPIFEGLSDYRNYREQDTQSIIAQNLLDKATRDVEGQLAGQKINYQQALTTARNRYDVLALSRKLYRQNFERFRSGRADFNTLELDQNRYLESEQLASQGWKNAHKAFGELCLATGRRLKDCLGTL